MSPNHQAYFFAAAAAIVFSTASFVFTEYSRKISSIWMSFFKALVCFVLFSITTFLFSEWVEVPQQVVGSLMLSGAIGLGVGDLFLLKAYARIGPGRTLMLFGFQPLFIGVASWYFFNQDLNSTRLVAIVFFVVCLFLFSFEKFKESGRWEVYGLLAALTGVICDDAGVLLSRWSFETVKELQPLQANFIRCAGALAFYIVANPFLKTRLIFHFSKLKTVDRTRVIVASAGGTFVSLLMYLTAIRIGHLASVAAIGVIGPLFTMTVECILDKRLPSKYLWAALVSFLCGFLLLIEF